MAWQIAGAVAGGILGGVGALKSSHEQNKAALKNYKAAITSLSTNYNYGVLANTVGIKSEFDGARRTLENLKYNSKQNQSSIRAAVGETNTEGRSVAKLEQSVEAHDLRTDSSVKENYQLQAANYVRQIEADRIATLSQMAAKKQEYKNNIISAEQTFFNMLSGSMKGAQTGYSFGGLFGGGVGANSSWHNVGGARGSSTGTGGGFNMGGGKVSGL
jgi:hypothetical protein